MKDSKLGMERTFLMHMNSLNDSSKAHQKLELTCPPLFRYPVCIACLLNAKAGKHILKTALAVNSLKLIGGRA